MNLELVRVIQNILSKLQDTFTFSRQLHAPEAGCVWLVAGWLGLAARSQYSTQGLRREDWADLIGDSDTALSHYWSRYDLLPTWASVSGSSWAHVVHTSLAE